MLYFHIALKYLSLLGKMYSDSGLDLLTASGVYAGGKTSEIEPWQEISKMWYVRPAKYQISLRIRAV